MLYTPLPKCFIAQAIINTYHHYIIYKVTKSEGIQACRHTLDTIFKEQYHHHIVIEKPFLTKAYKQAHLAWALVHRNWPPWI